MKNILIAYWILCFFLTHLPPSNVPQVANNFDKAFHFAGYMLLAILFQFNRRRGVLVSLLVLTAYSLFDELTQPYVGRTFDWLDLLADFIGSSLGISSVWWALNRTKIFLGK